MEITQPVNITGILWPITVLVGMVLGFCAIRKGQLKGLSFENGKLTISATQQLTSRTSSRYRRDRAIAEIDHALYLKAKEATSDQKRYLRKALKADTLCYNGLVAVVGELISALYDAVDENDFKHKLTVASKAGYIKEKVRALQIEYEDFLEAATKAPCSDNATPTIYPRWDEIEPFVERSIAEWASQVASAVIDACRKKIAVYKDYMPEAEASKDQDDINVLVECISKNRAYIEQLGGRP